MAEPYDPMKDPSKHTAPAKTLADKVIELALSAGGGAVTLLSGLLAAVLILYSSYVIYDSFAIERAASSNAWDLLQFKPVIFEDTETALNANALSEINQDYRAWLTVYGTDIDLMETEGAIVKGQTDTEYTVNWTAPESGVQGAEARFLIVPASNGGGGNTNTGDRYYVPSNVPRTGDDSNLTLWGMAAAASLAGAVLTLRKRKRSH